MKNHLTFIVAILVFTSVIAQKKIEKTIPWKANQKLTIDLDHPDVKIHTWDKNEVSITGTASINRGENDDAFELVVEETPGLVKISSALKNKESIPQRIVIKRGDQEYYFKAT